MDAVCLNKHSVHEEKRKETKGERQNSETTARRPPCF